MRVSFQVNNEMHNGAIQVEGESATLAVFGKKLFSVGNTIKLAGANWTVDSMYTSPYIPSITNIVLKRI